MRPKQLFTLTLLLFANFFLLAHAVLPHSHHDGIVCFSLEEIAHHGHCTDCHHSDIADYGCSHHAENHHQHSLDDCNLKDLVLRQSNDTHDDILPCANCLSLLYTIYSLNDLYFEAPEFGQWLQLKPYLETYIPPYLGSTRSLRAPPVSYFLG
ncbi:MAG: hypothetical protein E6767_08225 [Dysgonomonas sp.]|nr:hypothetical protein [Dysgonomonas sp.]